MLTRTTALLAAGLLAAAAGAAEPVASAPRCPVATQQQMMTVAYQVAELVVPVGCPAGQAARARENDLIHTITEAVAPQSWAPHGGRGTVDYFPMTMTLVINQTPDVQAKVAGLLNMLRREQDTQVALEVRLVSVPDIFFERIGVDFSDPVEGSGQAAAKRFIVNSDPFGCVGEKGAFLTDQQVARFLEAAQGDQRANVMQAPKLTVLNGQTAHVDCSDRQNFVTSAEVVQRDGRPVIIPKTEEIVTGFRMSACPVVSADGRFVQLSLDVNQTDLASPAVPGCPVTVEIKDDQGKNPVPFTQFLQQPKVNTIRIQKTLMIPDGGTALLGGLKKDVEVRTECGPPCISSVPYLNRLFKNVGTARESQTVYVLVTPRVINGTEQEQRAAAPPCVPAPCCPVAQACGTPSALPEVQLLPKLVRPNPACHGEECHSGAAPSCGQEKAIAELLKAYDEECDAAPAPSCGQAKVMAELLKAYDEACAAGRTAEAAKLAQAALVLDPTCFAKSRGR